MKQDEFVELYTAAVLLSRQNNQTVGEKNDYYVTLEQLERLIQSLLSKPIDIEE